MRFCDPTITPGEAPRISTQAQQILDRLREGSATNRELAAISLKYTGRISDLRANGHDIQVIDRDRATGLVRYGLLGGEK